MKYSKFLLLLFLLPLKMFSQKLTIDSTIWDTWPSLDEPNISTHGNYFSYSVRFIATQRVKSKYSVIKSLNSSWEKKIFNAKSSIQLTNDEKFGIFQNDHDSLEIIQLGNQKVDYISDIKDFTLINNYIIYSKNQDPHKLNILNLTTSKLNNISNVDKYYINEEELAILYVTSQNNILNFTWYDLGNNLSDKIWSGNSIDNLYFDNQGKRIFFSSRYNDKFSIWQYDHTRKKELSHEIINDLAYGLSDSLTLSGISGFSKDGKILFITLKNKQHDQNLKNADLTGLSVEVWNYNDLNLGSQAQNEIKEQDNKSYFAIAEVGKNRIVQLEDGRNKTLIYHNDDIAIIENKVSKISPQYQSLQNYSINYFRDGTVKNLNLPGFLVSSKGKFLFYYDTQEKNIFTYELKSGKSTNITKSILTDWTQFDYDSPFPPKPDISESIWLDNDNNLILHDQYDLWQVDPSGNKNPICLTNHFGKTENISFYIPLDKIILKNRTLIIPALNRLNKDNGFYKIKLDQSANPEKLSMQPVVYNIPKEQGIDPIKAKKSDIWIISKMTADQFPNYYKTKDFRSFTSITTEHPESKYNWMTSELHSWNGLNGEKLQGILYKPENFDSTKLYPLIIYYYEKFSNNLHVFLKPEMSVGALNIPWFVSRDYLVFVPDIHYKIGEVGQSTLSSVISATKYLSKKTFINKNKIGIQGHSFGGYETNYIITHSNLYAAACTASGISNFVSGYNSINNGIPLNYLYENFQFRMNATLWDTPDKYIENSPIFSLNNVTTPVLIMHTKNDNITLLPQALELFSGLRRLNKKSWLLLYNNASHTLRDKKDIIDFTTRLTQFYDYYLKDQPAPVWMFSNTPLRIRSEREGFQLSVHTSNP